MLALIKNQRDQRTVLLSTHTLNEIEQVAQRVLMLKSGQIVVDEPLDGLLKKKQLTQLHPVTLEQIFIDYHQDTPSPQLSTQG